MTLETNPSDDWMRLLAADERAKLEELAQKYGEEKQKRLRAKPAEHMLSSHESRERMDIDPHASPHFSRAPMIEEVDTVIIGGGFCGLMTAARLRRAGVDNILIIEKGADFGGTWYWNRYPGCRCDTESYIYFPLVEELGYVPTEKFTTASEIFAYSRALAKHFDLYRNACFQTSALDVRWNEEQGRWIIRTDRDDSIAARFTVLATGALTLGTLPSLPGEESFKGHTFHASRWDYEYTGGDPSGSLPNLADKTVAVVGTASTAVQIVPYLAAAAKKLYVVQRTPTMVIPRGNPQTDAAWKATLSPGWQQRRREAFESALAAGTESESGVAAGWLEIWGPPVRKVTDNPELAAEALAQVDDFRRLERVRAHIDDVVKDRATAESLKPYFHRFCKRPSFNDDYLQTFNRPNVQLIDTKGAGVERLSDDGMTINGRNYPVDCIVYATGFEIAAEPDRAGGFALSGRDGVTLAQKWRNGRRTLFGLFTRGFPNLFILGNVRQAAASPNGTYAFDSQSKLLARVIERALRDGAKTVEVSQAAEDAWVQRIRTNPALNYFRTITAGCTPGVYNGFGTTETLFTDTFTDGAAKYGAVLESWFESGYERDLEVSRQRN